MAASVKSATNTGASGLLIDIECSLSNNLPRIVIVGFANKAVDEAKERIRGAFVSSNIRLPRKRITINLAPADLPKNDSGFDLAIAVSILLASEQITNIGQMDVIFVGELGLDGSIRAVRGIIGKILAARAEGFDTICIPEANLAQAQLVPGVRLIAVRSLLELFECLNGDLQIEMIDTGPGIYSGAGQLVDRSTASISEIAGQDLAKRALEIAAAGGHNLFLMGPPGTGKSMLAKALPSVLPALSHEEMLEVTQLHSLASHNYEQIIANRPFRAPHHSASHVAITGGGTNLRPGEISLAHRGVLLFDELPEFERATLEALRQPLEDRIISIARAKDTVEYPANFMLVATANPCPCGYFGTRNTAFNCRCEGYQINHYQRKLSGPIMDRIDLYSNVHEVDHGALLTQAADSVKDDALRLKILKARAVQAQRYSSGSKLNADMSNADVRGYAKLDRQATKVLNAAAAKMNLSARAYMRTVKVARTIADLEACLSINADNISEALAYRSKSIQANT